MSTVFASVLPWTLVVVGSWMGYQLVRQNGRILLRLETIEKLLAARDVPPRQEPQGLNIGTPAPDFELPDLSGEQHRLSEFRGRELLLIFFNPQCGFCTAMADDLAKLPTDGRNGRPVPLVITTGDSETNRRLIQEHGVRCTVLRQDQMEVAAQYQAAGTPMGYRIDAAGNIASELTVGADALLRLAQPDATQRQASGKDRKPYGKKPDPSLSRSRLQRNGLKAGTVAPEFQLPRIEGGELALADLRGRQTLLVFSDPDCGPCDEVAPLLQEIHESRPDLQVVVISRRDADATRAKADRLGLTYPIVMQKQWEISLKYAMFATPIGYLIDEHGVLLSDVAVGVRPILALADPALPARVPAPSHNRTLIAGTT
jgi:peroxiredoxin